MRLTVFGATGGTGQQLVRQALAAGNEVVAVVRDPARLPVPDGPGLRVVQAGITDRAAIVPAVEHADAVVSALGPRGRGPTTVCSDAAASILTAMAKTGVTRLAAVSAAGAFADPADGLLIRLVVKPLLQRVFREGYADVALMEDRIRASGTSWTIVRAPRLTSGPHRGRYRTAIDAQAGRSISRADLADAILAAVADDRTVGHVLGAGY